MPDPARLAADELAACPNWLHDTPGRRAHTGRLDALQLASDVRDIDPKQIWGRLVLWGHHSPERLLTAMVTLAAMVDPERPQNHALEWADPIGGTAALQPDHDHRSAAA